MKKAFITTILSLFVAVAFAQDELPFAIYTPAPMPKIQQQSNRLVSDGLYNAVVIYTSHTGHEAQYRLRVKVFFDQVVKIYFGNGGYIEKDHIGDYEYRGGDLKRIYTDNGYYIGIATVVKKINRRNRTVDEYAVLLE